MSLGTRIGTILAAGQIPLATFQPTVRGCTKDDGSGIYCPANATEWAAVMAAATLGTGNPGLTWNCQDLSGSLKDGVGSFSGTVTGTGVTYQNVVSGWSRLAIGFADNSTGNIANTSSSLPSLATQSMLTVAYVKITGAASTRDMLSIGTGSGRLRATVTATPTFHLGLVSGAGTKTSTTNVSSRVLPLIIRHNHATSTQTLYTDIDKLTPTFSASAGQKLNLGANAVTTPAMTVLYLASFFGTAAEMTDAALKKLLQVLRWNIYWS